MNNREYSPDICILVMDNISSTLNNSTEVTPFINKIDNILDLVVKKSFVHSLSNCKCCDRHQINKPLMYNKLLEIPVCYMEKSYCTCPCRHYSRWICRTHCNSDYPRGK